MSTWTKPAIHQNIVAFLTERFPLFDPDASDIVPLPDHGVDSLGITEMVMHLEEEFRINVEDNELTRENLGTVQAVVSYIARKLRIY